jgi:glutamyl-tRNA(Gln) amidotransferase subunit E
MGGGDNDTLVAVWGSMQDAALGASEIALRAREATIGVPSETRQALRDGTNGFERILPGPNRMYPDTDLPPLRITTERLQKLRAGIPPPYWERERWYHTLGVPQDLVGPLSISLFANLFARAVKEWAIAPAVAAETLVQCPKRIRKKLARTVAFTEETMREVLLAVRERHLAREGIVPALLDSAQGKPFVHTAVPPPFSEEDLSTIVDSCTAELATTTMHSQDKAKEYLMGRVMKRVRGRIPGRTVARHLGLIGTEDRP